MSSKQPKGLAAARARRLADSRAERQVVALERIAHSLELLALVIDDNAAALIKRSTRVT